MNLLSQNMIDNDAEHRVLAKHIKTRILATTDGLNAQ
jgi:hypothetical protein